MKIIYNNEGLVPVIIQDNTTLKILMLGYMNEEAFSKTTLEKRVTFFSRSRQRLWTKGETSGNFLEVKSISIDCDRDAILIQAVPAGVTCHTGSVSCFGHTSEKGYLYALEDTISTRIKKDVKNSYTNKLFRRGINKIAQKVGEEAIELVIESKDNDEELFKNEAADLLFHFLILLKAKDLCLEEIEQVLSGRNGR